MRTFILLAITALFSADALACAMPPIERPPVADVDSDEPEVATPTLAELMAEIDANADDGPIGADDEPSDADADATHEETEADVAEDTPES